MGRKTLINSHYCYRGKKQATLWVSVCMVSQIRSNAISLYGVQKSAPRLLLLWKSAVCCMHPWENAETLQMEIKRQHQVREEIENGSMPNRGLLWLLPNRFISVLT